MQRGRHYRTTLPNRSSATRSDSPSQARAFRRSISARLTPYEFREPSIRRLGRALERLEIDVNHAEAAAVAFRPLEVIDERPDEIAAQFYPGGEGAAGGGEVLAQISDAIVVVYGAVRRERIVVASAILGHVEVRIAVAVAQADQLFGEGARVDRPADRRKARAGRRRAEPRAKEALRRVHDVHRRVVIDAEIVDGLSHRREIAVGGERGKIGRDRGGIGAGHQRIE